MIKIQYFDLTRGVNSLWLRACVNTIRILGMRQGKRSIVGLLEFSRVSLSNVVPTCTQSQVRKICRDIIHSKNDNDENEGKIFPTDPSSLIKFTKQL